MPHSIYADNIRGQLGKDTIYGGAKPVSDGPPSWNLHFRNAHLLRLPHGHNSKLFVPFQDIIQGNVGKDILYGQAGKDTISGGIGKDTLFGGKDADVLDGNQGADLVYGCGDEVMLTSDDTLADCA